ncbi:hypothetical protein [Kitasatospora sp. MAP5-34]|nr:hypothetical protein [Kitasatospora sp. MAP5-34]MDH6575732.1 hypothetical protein [Kitasatospora sp. MAP5-34]
MSEGVHTIHQQGSRYYSHPESGDLDPSVTSILKSKLLLQH